MSTASNFVIRGRCACGKRYRIRNAQPGTPVTCPKCQRVITVTYADLLVTTGGDSLLRLESESVAPKEAILIDYGVVRPAAQGARPGLSDGVAYTHEEAMLKSAMAGRPIEAPTGLPVIPLADEQPARHERTFVNDLLSSFYFAGNTRNAWNILVTALACSVMYLGFLLPGPFILLVVIPFFCLVTAHMIRFYWQVLEETARGDDDIAWFDTDWDIWDDVIRPVVWVGVISFLCTLPAIWVRGYYPAGAEKTALIWAALAFGWLFWPVAVMSVALGGSILFIRPDWLVRCMIGIGPVYLIAYLLIMATLWGWMQVGALNVTIPTSIALAIVLALTYPIALIAVNLYFGYVTFRMLGLLFRHFRHRFPWKY